MIHKRDQSPYIVSLAILLVCNQVYFPVNGELVTTIVTSGHCPKGSEITSESACNAAAKSLGLTDTSASTNDGKSSFRPPFCSFDDSYSYSQRLRFNKGGGNTGDCSSSARCLCQTGCDKIDGCAPPPSTSDQENKLDGDDDTWDTVVVGVIAFSFVALPLVVVVLYFCCCKKGKHCKVSSSGSLPTYSKRKKHKKKGKNKNKKKGKKKHKKKHKKKGSSGSSSSSSSDEEGKAEARRKKHNKEVDEMQVVVHGGVVNGAVHGGAVHGGVMHGGAVHGGAVYGGVMHGGVMHGGAVHGGAVHGGVVHTAVHGVHGNVVAVDNIEQAY